MANQNGADRDPRPPSDGPCWGRGEVGNQLTFEVLLDDWVRLANAQEERLFLK